MAFVREDIPEEYKAKHKLKIVQTTWFIDHSRNIFLIPSGGIEYGKIKFFDLGIGEHVASISVRIKLHQIQFLPVAVYDVKYTVIPDISASDHVSWQYLDCSSLKPECTPREFVEGMLKAYGYLGNPSWTGEVTVEFEEYKPENYKRIN